MSIRNTILCTGFVVFLAACDLNRTEDAMRLSNQVGAVNDSLTYYGKKWSDELQIAVGNKDFSQLQPIRSEMQDYIERKILDITSMRDVGGSQQLRNAELDLLTFDRDSILPIFRVFETFDAGTPDEHIVTSHARLMNTLRNESGRSGKVDSLRNVYADDNDFPKPISR